MINLGTTCRVRVQSSFTCMADPSVNLYEDKTFFSIISLVAYMVFLFGTELSLSLHFSQVVDTTSILSESAFNIKRVNWYVT